MKYPSTLEAEGKEGSERPHRPRESISWKPVVEHEQLSFLLLLSIIINLDLKYLKHVIIEMPLWALEAGKLCLGQAGPWGCSRQQATVLLCLSHFPATSGRWTQRAKGEAWTHAGPAREPERLDPLHILRMKLSEPVLCFCLYLIHHKQLPKFCLNVEFKSVLTESTKLWKQKQCPPLGS